VLLGAAPRWIVRIYTQDAAVIAGGAVLLRIAALFQLFDGLQVVATGALRGLGDTRTPMLAHLAGYWACACRWRTYCVFALDGARLESGWA